MAAPPQVNVLYRFAPGAWEDQAIGETPGILGGSIAGNVFSMWAIDSYTEYCYAWQTAPHLGTIQRFKCNFSVSMLPTIVGLPAEEIAIWTIFETAGYSDELWLDKDGYLKFYFGSNPVSTYPVAAGVTYAMEIYIKSDFDPTWKTTFQIYMNGELWLDEPDVDWWWWGPDSGRDLRMMAGSLYGGGYYIPDARVDVALSFTDAVWTMEDEQIGSGVWTMMALL